MLGSTEGPLETIIQNGSPNIGIGTSATLDGFTIRNGIGSKLNNAGGIHIFGGPVTVKNCWITENTGYDIGGGISIATWGVGIEARIINNIISYNESFWPDPHPEYARGGGIYVTDKAVIINNTIIGNIVHSGEGELYGVGGGIYIQARPDVLVANNNIIGNQAYGYPDMNHGLIETTIVEHNNMWNNIGDGKYPDPYLSTDPLFVQGILGDFFLSHIAAGQDFDSPCINAGNNSVEYWDLEQFTTRTDSVLDSGVVDIGYHYNTFSVPTPTATPHVSEGAFLELSGEQFTSGDHFKLVVMCNTEEGITRVDLYVLLDVYGEYWFHPDWTKELSRETVLFDDEHPIEIIILDFVWPEGDHGTADNLYFWSAITEAETFNIIGEIDIVEFGYY